MTTSSILRLVGRRANNLSAVASRPTIRSFSATAPAALACTTSNGRTESDIRGAAAVMAVAAAGGGLISWKSESNRADCAAITAVVGKGGFGARCVVCKDEEKSPI